MVTVVRGHMKPLFSQRYMVYQGCLDQPVSILCTHEIKNRTC